MFDPQVQGGLLERKQGRRTMGGGGGVLKTLFLGLVFVGFIWFLLVEIVANGETQTTITPTATNFKRLDVIGRDIHVVHRDLDLNYMSKRRVPNGPDPIHNRRAGKSKQPPGRA